jgi:hypothetical protein
MAGMDRDVTQLIVCRGEVGRLFSKRCHTKGKMIMKEPNTLSFSIDLTLGEVERRAAIVEALGDDWDPAAVFAGEQVAYETLYGGLDPEQQRVYDKLVRAGVLPDRQVRRDAA